MRGGGVRRQGKGDAPLRGRVREATSMALNTLVMEPAGAGAAGGSADCADGSGDAPSEDEDGGAAVEEDSGEEV
jgi:hypothetical protein